MHPMINIAVRASRAAGNTIMRALEHLDSVAITEKSHNDFVTEVDKLAEQEIIQAIRKVYPNHGILAEESGRSGNDDYTWIIDPLDGTTNFMHGFPHFAVSIGIQYKNKIEHGVIYDPVKQELFTASRGTGARLNERRLRVSPRKTLEGSLLGTGFPFKYQHLLSPYLDTLQELSPLAAGIRRAGSAALDLAYVAAGRLDGFWEIGLSPWDIAAGSLLIKEAGGLISDFNGAENYFQTGNIITANPKIFKAMVQLIQPILGSIEMHGLNEPKEE